MELLTGRITELEDILSLPQDASLDVLDATLRRFISFSSRYHGTPGSQALAIIRVISILIAQILHKIEEYLQTKAQLDYCCELLLESDFFTFHSDRSTDLILEDARVVRCKQFDTNALFSSRRSGPDLPLL